MFFIGNLTIHTKQKLAIQQFTNFHDECNQKNMNQFLLTEPSLKPSMETIHISLSYSVRKDHLDHNNHIIELFICLKYFISLIKHRRLYSD